MLSQDKRKQLDGIVQTMIDHKESDSNIRFIIEDFKKKHDVPEQAPPQAQGDLLSKASGVGEKILGFTGGQNLAEVGGTLAKGAFQKGSGMDLLTPEAKARITPQQAQAIQEPMKSTGVLKAVGQQGIGRVAGDVGQITTTLAPFGLKGAPTILGKAAQFGTIGAAGAGSRSLSGGANAKKTVIDAFVGGLTGAALGATVGVVSKGLSSFANKTPKATYNNALRVSTRIKNAGKSPAEFLAKEGVWGDLGAIHKTASDGIAKESAIISERLAPITEKATYNQVRDLASKKLSQDLGNLFTKSQIAGMIDDVPTSALKANGGVSYKALNSTRSQLGKYMGDAKWLSNTPSENVSAYKAVYHAMAEMIQSKSNTAENFARETQWIRALKAARNAINVADSKYGIGLMDIIAGTGGATIGAGQGNTVGERARNALIGGGAAIATEKLARSATLQTGTAQLISKLNNLPTDSAGRIGKAAVLKLIGNLIGGDSNK